VMCAAGTDMESSRPRPEAVERAMRHRRPISFRVRAGRCRGGQEKIFFFFFFTTGTVARVSQRLLGSQVTVLATQAEGRTWSRLAVRAATVRARAAHGIARRSVSCAIRIASSRRPAEIAGPSAGQPRPSVGMALIARASRRGQSRSVRRSKPSSADLTRSSVERVAGRSARNVRSGCDDAVCYLTDGGTDRRFGPASGVCGGVVPAEAEWAAPSTCCARLKSAATVHGRPHGRVGRGNLRHRRQSNGGRRGRRADQFLVHVEHAAPMCGVSVRMSVRPASSRVIDVRKDPAQHRQNPLRPGMPRHPARAVSSSRNHGPPASWFRPSRNRISSCWTSLVGKRMRQARS
jgi:hypothetical protein